MYVHGNFLGLETMINGPRGRALTQNQVEKERCVGMIWWWQIWSQAARYVHSAVNRARAARRLPAAQW